MEFDEWLQEQRRQLHERRRMEAEVEVEEPKFVTDYESRALLSSTYYR